MNEGWPEESVMCSIKAYLAEKWQKLVAEHREQYCK
jgi:hypothetical protein